MDSARYEQFKQSLLSQIQHFAPTGHAYADFVKQLQRMEREESDNMIRYRYLITTITDGILYGNWPWVGVR